MISREEAMAKAKELLAALRRQSLPEWQRNMADAVGDDALKDIASEARKPNPVTSGDSMMKGKGDDPGPVRYGGDIPSPNWRPRAR